MKNFTKIVSTAMLFSFTLTSSYAALSEVSCSTNQDFTANSCSQCFTGGTVSVGDNKGLLTDIWENNSDANQVLFKEEQEMPQMIALGGANWTEVKASDSVDFWEFTSGLEALYDDDNLGYTLAPGASVTWIESTLGSAYQVVSNAPSGSNAGILAYDIAVHMVEDDGNIALETESHRECVLYTSAGEASAPSEVVVPSTPTLPATGPEHMLLALVALLLGFGFLKFRK